MFNLIDQRYPKDLAAKYGFYILCRVKHHVYITEPWDPGWGEAADVLTQLWVHFDVFSRDNRAERELREAMRSLLILPQVDGTHAANRARAVLEGKHDR